MTTGLCNSEMLCLFDVGMRVKVSDRQYSYLSKRNIAKVNGAYGTVSHVDTHYEKIVVELDGAVNDLSATGHFFFKPRELIILDKNNNIMEEKTMAVSNIKNYTNAIKIKNFGDGKPGYGNRIFASFEPELKVDDLIVVKTVDFGISLARVSEILDGTDYDTVNEVIAKVNTDAFDERVKIRNQAAELKAKMEERAKQLQDVALYKMLAETDPAMMELLKEFQALPQT